jgi:hypothetical protein
MKGPSCPVSTLELVHKPAGFTDTWPCRKMDFVVVACNMQLPKNITKYQIANVVRSAMTKKG